jgi:PglD N-terminal domain
MKVLLVGAGSFAKMVAEILHQDSSLTLIGFADDNLELGALVYRDYRILSLIGDADGLNADGFLVAIGNVEVRKKIFLRLVETLHPVSAVHKNAVVSDGAQIGLGSVVLAGAVVNLGARVGRNSILNSNVLVDHDSLVGDHVNIGQGAVIGSNCVISDGYVSAIGEVLPSFSRR